MKKYKVMENLTFKEMKNIDGGNVPMAYYMDDDVIHANGTICDHIFSWIGGFVVGFFD